MASFYLAVAFLFSFNLQSSLLSERVGRSHSLFQLLFLLCSWQRNRNQHIWRNSCKMLLWKMAAYLLLQADSIIWLKRNQLFFIPVTDSALQTSFWPDLVKQGGNRTHSHCGNKAGEHLQMLLFFFFGIEYLCISYSTVWSLNLLTRTSLNHKHLCTRLWGMEKKLGRGELL